MTPSTSPLRKRSTRRCSRTTGASPLQPAITRASSSYRTNSAAAGGGAAVARLFGGGEGWGLRCGEDCGGFLGNARAFEKARVLRAPQLDRVREGEGAEVVLRDVAVLDQLISLRQRVAHVDHVEMPNIRTEDRVELGAERVVSAE